MWTEQSQITPGKPPRAHKCTTYYVRKKTSNRKQRQFVCSPQKRSLTRAPQTSQPQICLSIIWSCAHTGCSIVNWWQHCVVVLEPLVEQLVEDSVSKCTRTFMEKQLWDHSDHNSEHHRKRKHVGPQQALLRAWGDVLFFSILSLKSLSHVVNLLLAYLFNTSRHTPMSPNPCIDACWPRDLLKTNPCTQTQQQWWDSQEAWSPWFSPEQHCAW